MKYIISAETIQATANCKKGFSCLNGGRENICKVESTVSGKVIFVKCLNTDNCYYKLSFGQEIICTCPTRKAIFNNYGI